MGAQEKCTKMETKKGGRSKKAILFSYKFYWNSSVVNYSFSLFLQESEIHI